MLCTLKIYYFYKNGANFAQNVSHKVSSCIKKIFGKNMSAHYLSSIHCTYEKSHHLFTLFLKQWRTRRTPIMSRGRTVNHPAGRIRKRKRTSATRPRWKVKDQTVGAGSVVHLQHSPLYPHRSHLQFSPFQCPGFLLGHLYSFSTRYWVDKNKAL